MYNLIEYSNNYSDTSRSLWQFKRDEIERDVDLTIDNNHIPDNSSSFKYKSSLITNRNNVKIAVPLKYLSNFWRSSEMPLINCKIHLELNKSKDCVMSTIANTKFKITNTKLYVQIVTLSSKDNVKLVKLLQEGFKRPVYWNEYQTKIETKIQTKIILQDFLLMLLFKELEYCLFLLLTILIMALRKLKKTVTQNIFFQE